MRLLRLRSSQREHSGGSSDPFESTLFGEYWVLRLSALLGAARRECNSDVFA